jgi:hypothetical protein
MSDAHGERMQLGIEAHSSRETRLHGGWRFASSLEVRCGGGFGGDVRSVGYKLSRTLFPPMLKDSYIHSGGFQGGQLRDQSCIAVFDADCINTAASSQINLHATGSNVASCFCLGGLRGKTAQRGSRRPGRKHHHGEHCEKANCHEGITPNETQAASAAK